MIRKMLSIVTSLSLLALSVTARADVKPIDKAAHGKPAVKSIEVLSFGPEGVLLIGDGAGSQIVAVHTGDTKPAAPLQGKLAGIQAKLAAKVGAKAEGIEILDMAVNPASGKAYFAVRKQDDKSHLILTVTGAGEIGELALDSVDYVRVPLAASDATPIGKVTDVAWADDRLIAAASAKEEFASKIFTVSAPLKNDVPGKLTSAETYHVAHGKWETKAPMSVLMPIKEKGKDYVVGAFACTPIVKYPVDAITDGAKVKGISVIELGSGNRPIDMIAYEKGGKEFVLTNTYRFHHARVPFGPSPYWTVKFDRALLDEDDAVNEKAIRRLKGATEPATDKIQMVESLHGVTQMDNLGSDRVLVLRTTEAGLDLEAVPLP